MCEETTKCDTIIAHIKKLLFNYDLAIEYAKGEIRYHDCNMKLYANSPKQKVKFISHKIDKEKFEIYKQELINSKEQVLSVLNSVLDKYNPTYKKIFFMKFFEDMTDTQIADECGYTDRGIRKIISKMKNDFIDISI